MSAMELAQNEEAPLPEGPEAPTARVHVCPQTVASRTFYKKEPVQNSFGNFGFSAFM